MTSGPLDLSGADTSGFDPLPSGRYVAAVYEAEWTETKGGENAKLPAGTPMLKVQMKLLTDLNGQERIEVDTADGKKEMTVLNRRVFSNFTIPPEGYENAAKLKGMFVRFLVALGNEESKVTGGKFKLDIEELIGQECVVVVGRGSYNGEPNNTVQGFRAMGEAVGAGGLL